MATVLEEGNFQAKKEKPVRIKKKRANKKKKAKGKLFMAFLFFFISCGKLGLK